MSASKEIIEKLSKLKVSNSISSYPHIKNILKNQRIPIAFTELKPFKLIRYRSHNDGNRDKLFGSSKELSYRTDILNINEFGRANESGQGLFYCNDNENQNTGITEIVSIFRGNINSEEEVLTIGAWDVNQNLTLAMILPSEQIIGNNKDFDMMKADFNRFEESPEFEDLKILNEFLANEFTLDIEKHNSNYKISCAFAMYIKEQIPEVDGIMYASVKSEYKGVNIVLWPEVVDKKLEFVAARKTVFKKTKHKTFVEELINESVSYNREKDEINW
ncbi:RES domain-containing protein [Dokdonia sp. Hel_I_63]|uniref:RES domain-containing protein n=1 Tax=Dokdonia sp. Hel_I_63 TaxID=1249996 RepID=UPI00119BC519|nr:RES domain-containing protein [Dokdonia sp. Hel_I_63]TVZ22692.1 RES domain-containing protein [Dokdonia sp. Hel_I_63]